MENYPFHEKSKSFKSWMREHQSGLYLTLIFHLIVLIALTLQGIHGQIKSGHVFIFDFTKQEAEQAKQEQKLKEQKQKEEIEKEVDDLIRAAIGASNKNTPRNVVVNTADLKDGSNVKSTLGESKNIYEEAKALQQRLDATRKKIEEQQGVDEVPVTNNHKKEPVSQEIYKGPTVLSYTLDGRKAINMPVPVYKCQGGGDVTVTIEVNKQGYVTNVWIHTKASTDNVCLHDAAKNAAYRSRFNIDTKAPEKQKGEIVYRFIPQ